MPRVLHVLSQRPSLTGSGITLESLVRCATRAGWTQEVVCGVPAGAPAPDVGGLPLERVKPVVFGPSADLEFALPGMSDVMPYPSSVWSQLSDAELRRYRRVWRAHLARVIDDFEPDLVHSHHLWVVSGLLKDVAPGVPVVTHCHATGLRQMELCPRLAPEVIESVRRNERVCVLHRDQADEVARRLSLDPKRITVVGAGYREDCFNASGRPARSGPVLLYAGKFSAAKGLPWLLDAAEHLRERRPELRLLIAGSGAGAEADGLRERMAALPWVELHGQVDQPALAELCRRAHLFVLPSFYEGLPLVLAEALACGCRLVATRLPGIAGELAPAFGDLLTLVDPPGLRGTDTPVEEDLPAFVQRLMRALDAGIDQPPPASGDALRARLLPFTWTKVFERVEGVWHDTLAATRSA